MAYYRLSRLAEVDLRRIVSTSEEQWGTAARRHYAAVMAAAMRKVANDPMGLATRDRAELLTGIRSIHLRYVRTADSGERVKNPVHVLYYRNVASDFIEIVRILHERMEPRRHLGVDKPD